MGNYLCEMFAHFVYGEQLSYQDLLDREDLLTRDSQHLWEKYHAAHINYSPLGDALMVQCVFREYDVQLFQDICDELQPLLCQEVTGRLLFVDKALNCLHVYSLTEQGWHEASLRIPQVSEALPFADPQKPKRAPKASAPPKGVDAAAPAVKKKKRASAKKELSPNTAPAQ